jgi:hypothetical protein
MALVDEIARLNNNLESAKVEPKRKFFKIPWRVSWGAGKPGKLLVVFLGLNRKARFLVGEIVDGLIRVDGKFYGMEEVSVYSYSKKFSVVVIFEWRLLAAGGKAEEYRSRVIGGEDDVKVAEATGIRSFGALTIIRAIENAELDKSEKKKGFGAWIFWIIGGIVVIFIISKLLSGGFGGGG